MHPLLDEQLLSIAHESRAICSAVSKALRVAFSNNHDGKPHVTFALHTKFGTVIEIPETTAHQTRSIASHPLSLLLKSEEEGEEKIGLMLGTRQWNLVSCFSIGSIVFYPTITLPAPPDALRWIRYELLAALDCFGLRCKAAILNYYGQLASFQHSGMPGTIESGLVQKLAHFSGSIKALSLVDEDGFVLAKAGSSTQTEEIAGSAALFNRHVEETLHAMGETTINFISMSDGNACTCFGRVSQKNVFLSITAVGVRPSSTARLLLEIAFNQFASLKEIKGSIFSTNDCPVKKAFRTRTSWLTAPALVAQGEYVYRTVEKIFHLASCTSLSAVQEAEITWVATRRDALHAGLQPCTLCHP